MPLAPYEICTPQVLQLHLENLLPPSALVHARRVFLHPGSQLVLEVIDAALAQLVTGLSDSLAVTHHLDCLVGRVDAIFDVLHVLLKYFLGDLFELEQTVSIVVVSVDRTRQPGVLHLDSLLLSLPQQLMLLGQSFYPQTLLIAEEEVDEGLCLTRTPQGCELLYGPVVCFLESRHLSVL